MIDRQDSTPVCQCTSTEVSWPSVYPHSHPHSQPHPTFQWYLYLYSIHAKACTGQAWGHVLFPFPTSSAFSAPIEASQARGKSEDASDRVDGPMPSANILRVDEIDLEESRRGKRVVIVYVFRYKFVWVRRRSEKGIIARKDFVGGRGLEANVRLFYI